MGQFSFNLGHKSNFTLDDYHVTIVNEDIFNFVELWPNWGAHRLSNIIFIQGPESSGKTHIAHIWQEKTAAIFLNKNNILNPNSYMISHKNCFILENIEQYADCEEQLFHLINYFINEKKYLLITSKHLSQNLSFKLEDLNSRLKALTSFSILEPDDELFKVLLVKQCYDRQIRISPDVVNYLSNNMERSYQAIKEIVDLIDEATLSQKRAITIPMIKELLNLDK